MSFPRYPKYKPSGVEWLGEVPKHWEISQLKRLLQIQNGSDHKHVEQAEGYPVIGSGGVFAYASDYLYDGESVLLGRKGTIDKPLYVTGRFWTVDTMFWTKIQAGVSARFTYYSATTLPFEYYSTNTALPSMTKGALAGHLVAIPPLAEQTLIAAFLDRETAKIDALVSEQERLMALLKEKRQAVISHAVTKGLNPAVRMKPSGIEWLGDVPEHWELIPVWLLFEIGRGRVISHDTIAENEGIFPVYSSQTENDGVMGHLDTFDFDGDYITWTTDGANAGTVFRRSGKFNCTNVCGTLKPRLRMSLDYCQSALAVSTAAFVRHDINPKLMNNVMAKIRIPVPPVDEQAGIAAVIDYETAKLDTLTAEAQRAIDLLQERRTALISASVTGQIDVREARA